MSRPVVVPDVQYVKGSQKGKLTGRLKYFQYRKGSIRRREYLQEGASQGNDNDPALRRDDPTWVDRGMGTHYGEVLERCDQMQGSTVLAWTHVMSPDPELLKEVPEDERAAFTARLTESTMADFSEHMGWGEDHPYSYVVHDLETEDGLPRQHSHIVMPGTHYELGERVDSLVYERHIDQLHDIASDNMKHELSRTIGLERTAELMAERGHGLPNDLHHRLHQPEHEPFAWIKDEELRRELTQEPEPEIEEPLEPEPDTPKWSGPSFDMGF